MGNESHDFLPDMIDGEPQAGPSWQRRNWPLTGPQAEDDLTQALDPMALKAETRMIFFMISSKPQICSSQGGQPSIRWCAAQCLGSW